MPERGPSIGAGVVEAAARLLGSGWEKLAESERADWRVDAEAAIAAADKARGLREEQREPPAGTSIRIQVQTRLLSDWRPVDAERITHGRHCVCSACAAQDWAEPGLAPCGIHGSSCPLVYAPLGDAGDIVSGSSASVRVDTEPSERPRLYTDGDVAKIANLARLEGAPATGQIIRELDAKGELSGPSATSDGER